MLLSILILSHACITASPDVTDQNGNAIQLGKAKVGVAIGFINWFKDPDDNFGSYIDSIDIYCNTRSLFDSDRDGTLIPLSKLRNELVTYQQDITLECKEEVVGLSVYMNSEFIGGTECIIRQDSPTAFIIAVRPTGEIDVCKYPEGTMLEWMNIGAVGYNSEMVDPSVFYPRDRSLYDKSWEAVTDNLVNTRWPEFLKQSIDTITLPNFAEDWVINTLKKRFAAASILPYVSNADKLLDKSIPAPPMEAYYFLDSINYNPDVFLKNEMNFPQAWLLNSILKYPDGGFESIGETPVAQWQEYADKKLAPAMKERPKLLLDLLSGMSYVNQIDEGTPLTDTQIKNIQEGYTDDIGKIILARNKKLLSAKNDSKNP